MADSFVTVRCACPIRADAMYRMRCTDAIRPEAWRPILHNADICNQFDQQIEGMRADVH